MIGGSGGTALGVVLFLRTGLCGLRIGLLRGDLTGVSDDFHAFGWFWRGWVGGGDCCVSWAWGDFLERRILNFCENCVSNMPRLSILERICFLIV